MPGRVIVTRAILPVAGYWSLLLALSLQAQSPGAWTDLVLPAVVLMGMPLVVLASIILFREAHASGSMLAMRDELTGAGNRRAFVAQSQALMRKAKAGTLGLVVLDVDGLKQLNDTCGHQAGDELLAKVVKHLDAKGKLYRIGGDEFAVLVDRSIGEHMTSLMRTLEPFIATFESCGHAHEVRVSFGSTSNRENEKFQDLFRRADDSLIQHKRQLYSQGRYIERRGAVEYAVAPEPESESQAGLSPSQPGHLRLLS